MNNKILHISPMDKFIPPFIDFIDENFDIAQHTFVILGKPRYKYGLKEDRDIIWIDSISQIFKMILLMNKSDKIILHGLFSEILNTILFMQPWILKKCYWVMWGGDFYFPEEQSWIKKQVIKKISYLVTGTTGDYKLAKKLYNVLGKHIKCFNYPSNLYKEYNIKSREQSMLNIQVGNSADPTNNHIKVLEKLKVYKDEDIKIYAPLSYGDEAYAQEVIKQGKKLFGEKFIPLEKFIQFEKYLEFLSEIDIAIFAHKRQQAFGNIITLLGIGKKVYIHKASTLNGVFEEYNIQVFDVDNVELSLIDESVKESNIQNIKENFSKESLVKSLSHYLK